MIKINKLYRRLQKFYGPQGWWPIVSQELKVTVAPKRDSVRGKSRKLRIENDLTYGIPYYRLKKYRTSFRDPYFEIAVGAILTQSAAWRNVARAIINLYNAKTLTPEKILKLDSHRLQRLIRPAGYYKQKAKKIKIFSRWLIDNFGGDIRKLSRYTVQTMRGKLLALWGIGKETADSIILYALNKQIFVVDEYTRRLCRLFGHEFNDYDEYRHFFEKKIKTTGRFQEFHALIVASGKEKHKKINPQDYVI